MLVIKTIDERRKKQYERPKDIVNNVTPNTLVDRVDTRRELSPGEEPSSPYVLQEVKKATLCGPRLALPPMARVASSP